MKYYYHAILLVAAIILCNFIFNHASAWVGVICYVLLIGIVGQYIYHTIKQNIE
jgi:hypothetical protein